MSALCTHALPPSCPDCFYGPAKPTVHRDLTEVKSYWAGLSGVDLAGQLIPGLTPSERVDADRWVTRRETGRD